MNQNFSGMDRREFPRLKRNVPVKICSHEFDLVTETSNLSRSGAYCRSDKYIEPMTRLKIQLLLPFKQDGKTMTRKVSCQGVIVRTESVAGSEAFNIAVFFNDIQRKDADIITDYVSSVMEE